MKKKSILLNPKDYQTNRPDGKTDKIMQETIQFFEHKGLKSIREDDRLKRWQEDWIRYQAEHEIFATLLTAKGYGAEDSRFDLARMCEMSELLAFYSEAYQYPFQVSILGVGPIWMGDNEEQKHELAEQLKQGHVFAFGMSEKTHGADLYSNECTIKPVGGGKYAANGNKYYIGNCHIAPKITTLGRNTETGEWTYWVVDSRNRHYNYVKAIQTQSSGQAIVGEYEMIEYPLTDRDILKSGDQAFADGLSTINIGKFQLGFAASGIAAHSLYEALTHSNRRVLYGRKVTDFPHIRAFLSEAFCRANAMKLYSLRSLDYFRSMSAEDRRYLLFNPIQKMKATTQGTIVIQRIMDVVCAKGYEQENYISDANLSMQSLARLEGTVHVNMSLVMKFMKNYFFGNVEYPEIPVRSDAKDDANIFDQRIGGLGLVQFPDYRKAYEGVDLANVKIFLVQIEIFKEMLSQGAPDQKLLKNMDYMLSIGEIFTSIVYAQLVLEGSKLHNIHEDLVNQIFSCFVKDVCGFALAQLNSQNNSEVQENYLKALALTKPVIDKEADFKFWKEFVEVLDGAYIMNDAAIGNEIYKYEIMSGGKS